MTAIYAPLIIVGIGVWLFVQGIRRPRRPRRLGRQSLRSLYMTALALVLMAFGGLLTLRALNLRLFSPRSQDTGAPVAEVAVKALYPLEKTYAVTVLRLADGKRTDGCILKGERWVIGGAAQSWHWWSFAPRQTYTLMTISGQDAAGKTTATCDIALAKPKIDTFLPGRLIAWLIESAKAQDTPMNQAVAAPLNEGATYTVHLVNDGFVANADKSGS